MKKIEIAPAKINLRLKVLGKRDDGFHDIESLMVAVSGVNDRLTFEVNEGNGKVDLLCDLPGLSMGEDNLIIRAIELFKNTVGLDIEGIVTLEKFIPIGAGLGGAFATTSEPTIIVQGQVFVVVNDDTGAYDKNLLDGSTFAGLGRDIAMYMGSTTGSSYNNYDKCSPYSINWHVDRKCQLVSAKSLDEVCRRKIELGMKDDTHPHGSRELVSKDLSVDTLL